jgi:rhamnosyltransferase
LPPEGLARPAPRALPDLGVVVPTLNAGERWTAWLEALDTQGVRPGRVLVVDSSSTDRTAELARARGHEVLVIPRAAFNHGATRQLGVDLLAGATVVVFLTQDAILAGPDALARLVSAFDDPRVGTAFGRQLPHPNAGPIGAHARIFNYPPEGRTVTLADRTTLGIKAAFTSNSFAAYRRATLLEVGGFPGHVIMNEDTYVAARMLLAGWAMAYRADAEVYHSHDYRLREDFRRYFDIGVFHAREPWLRQALGGAEGEGLRFVRSELRYLRGRAPALIPSALARTGLKLLAYRLGLAEARLPLRLKRVLGMNRRYWEIPPISPPDMPP